MVDGYKPRNLAEALAIRTENPVYVIAGGTDLMVQKARGFAIRPEFDKPLIFIGDLAELQYVHQDNSALYIGAGATLTDLIKSPLIPAIFKETVSLMASPPSRNLATIGGNICNASPAGDTLPWLYAANAGVILKSQSNERRLDIDEFIIGPRQIVLHDDEILTEIIIPCKNFDINVYKKIGQRQGMSLTKASFLGMASTQDKKMTDIRIAFGSVAPTVVRSVEIEQSLIGATTEDIKKRMPIIINEYRALIRPIDDARSSAIYRKKVCLNLLEEFLKTLATEKHR